MRPNDSAGVDTTVEPRLFSPHFALEASTSAPQRLRTLANMLPEFVKDSYKQYKADTDRFATWLVNAAKKCGRQPRDWPQAADRGKGRTKTTAAPAAAKYRATISELKESARCVSEAAVNVPATVLALAKRAIALRKSVTALFLHGGSSDSNKRHAHFVEVLEDICQTLERGRAAEAPPSAHSDVETWVNRFAVLTVQEGDDDVKTGPDRRAMVPVEAAEDEDNDDGAGDDCSSHQYFRMLCLFRDLRTWRSFISETWKEYGEFKIDLMSATIVTETALQLARELIQEVTDNVAAELSQGLKMQQLIYCAASIARGKPTMGSVKLGLPFNKDLADIADWCYMGIGSLLGSFADVLKDGSLPVYKPGYFGVYNPKADRAKMSMVERFNEDKVLLMEILPEYAALRQLDVVLPVRDEITAGLTEFIQTKKPTLWLSFASQIMLDAHHAIRHSRVSVFSDLRMTGLRVVKTIDDYLKLSKTHPQPPFWPKEADDEIRSIRECIEVLIEKDPFKSIRLAATRALPARNKKTTSENLIFSRNPLLSGVLMFHLNLRMQNVGQALLTQWYDVQQVAFLYNLVQMAPGPKLVWPDLEAFIKIHGESHIFVGGRPKDASQSLKRLELATGISSPSRFASNARDSGRNRWRLDGKSARGLEPTTKVANLFREHYCATGKGSSKVRPIDSSNVGKLLDELSKAAPTTKGSKTSKTGNGSGPGETGSFSSQQLLERKWLNTHNVGALQLLVLIKNRLCEEEPVLMFDYFAMHRCAIELLRLIRDKEHHKLVQYFSAGYMPNESFIANVVLLIHIVARGSSQAAQQMDLARDGATIFSRIIVRCGEVMREYLAEHNNGDMVGKTLRTFCRNKRPLVNTGQDEAPGDGALDESFTYWFALEEVLDPRAMESLRTGIAVA
ncbi:hypothetical protein AAL_06177 [Moelleriella libera RCEF 2490]|uniref:DUF6604 domain-containing protein n=1 Tax=Moelleriella libera RCEF 2490 TaxID=1081109 RepID=A0A167ZEG3_9HYPO|nr:hypothetical protein AAL_06177 [Moelleriella libera RCEF 2490]